MKRKEEEKKRKEEGKKREEKENKYKIFFPLKYSNNCFLITYPFKRLLQLKIITIGFILLKNNFTTSSTQHKNKRKYYTSINSYYDEIFLTLETRKNLGKEKKNYVY